MIDDISGLRPGDKVRIISSWLPGRICHEASSGKMDRWLGQVMTVREVYGTDDCFMEEDIDEYRGNVRPGWVWNKYCIDEILSPDYEDETEEVSLDDYMSVLTV